jgi:poly(3-hydroxybutyrate) depolymerase
MTMHRAVTIGSALALGLAVGASSMAGCAPGGSGTTGNGSPGTAGTGAGTAGTGSATGTAGTGSATGTAGTGSATGTAGMGSATGTAGMGSATGTAGMGGGAAGTGAAGSGAAGTGAAGAAGTPGTAGTAGGGRPSGPSAGCMAEVPNEALGTAVSHNIDVTGMDPKYAGYLHRKYCTTIPKNYNPKTPYPVVFYGPGCGGFGCEGNSFSGRTDIFLVQATISDAKSPDLVPPAAAPGCFQMGRVTTPDSPEGYYFDQVMDEVEKNYCTDKGRIFVAGTSSGAWLANTLACQRGNRVRGSAADSGGIGFDRGTCKPGAAVMEMPCDSANTADGAGNQIGAAVARDLFIKLNGCSMTPTSMKFGNDTCDVYGGCDSPVVWCNVGGGHQCGNGHLSPTGWAFWNMLK